LNIQSATNRPKSSPSSSSGNLSPLAQLLGGIAIGVGALLTGLAAPDMLTSPRGPLSNGTSQSPFRPFPTFPAGFFPSNSPSAPEIYPWPTDIEETRTPWSPKLRNPNFGPTFQIILSGALNLAPGATSVSPDVDIYDLDLFMTDSRVISGLKRLNKTVMCYFSAGTYEPGRPDSHQFLPSDVGSALPLWPDERWLWHPSRSIRRIMANRIQLAAQKGCDAVDPDNIGLFDTR
jgi:Glycoside-hydrolase family GH114